MKNSCYLDLILSTLEVGATGLAYSLTSLHEFNGEITVYSHCTGPGPVQGMGLAQ